MVTRRRWLAHDERFYQDSDTWENLDGTTVTHRWLDCSDGFRTNDLTMHMKYFQDSAFIAPISDEPDFERGLYYAATGFLTRHLYYCVYIDIYDRFDREWIVEDGFDFWNQHFHESIDVDDLYSFIVWTDDAIHRSK